PRAPDPPGRREGAAARPGLGRLPGAPGARRLAAAGVPALDPVCRHVDDVADRLLLPGPLPFAAALEPAGPAEPGAACPHVLQPADARQHPAAIRLTPRPPPPAVATSRAGPHTRAGRRA